MMDKKIVFVIGLFVLLSSMLFARISHVEVKAVNGYPVHNVNTGKDYATIQEAINAPETLDGHVILVDPDVYYESVIVNKTVTVAGKFAETTIIDGGDIANYMFHVIASNVVIENFTLRNTDPDPARNSPAVRVANVINVTVKNVVVTNVVIGVEIRSANFTRIMHSRIYEAKKWGIYVHSVSWNETIVGNTFERNPTAVYFDFGCELSLVYNNNFVNNTNHVTSLTVNYFDDGYPNGGNYWSNYNGGDMKSGAGQNQPGSDGIGDSKYFVYGSLQDNYPLMGVFSAFPVTSDVKTCHVTVISNSTVSVFEFYKTNRTMQFNVSGVEGVGFCRISVPYGLIFPPCNVTIDDGQVEVANFNGNLYDNGTHRWIYFAYNHSDHKVTILSVALVRIESPSELSPNCTHPGTDIIVAYVYSEENSLNVTITVYNATDTIGIITVTDLENGTDIARDDTVTLESWAAEGRYDVKIVMYNTLGGLSGLCIEVNAVVVDVTPPVIGDVSQNPLPNNVFPEDVVRVSVKVSDMLSGVKQVILSYSVNESAWVNVTMAEVWEDIYTATIPEFSSYANVTYVVVAEDRAGNGVTTEEMGREYYYRVLSEFPFMFVLSLFMIATLVVAAIYSGKKRFWA